MKTLEAIQNRGKKLAIIGLGYVGLPLAVEFAKKIPTIGFDTNQKKLDLYRQGIDVTQEVGNDVLKNSKLLMTSDPAALAEAAMIIVAVPTPITDDNLPDLKPITDASTLIGQHISAGTIVCYESTVYPGVTENICAPIIEQQSGLVCGKDFKIAYSPERINPGDKEHRVFNIRKIVSAMDQESLDDVAEIYSLVIQAGVYKAESIKVAEAAKVAENSQRDINIAFVNELSLAFHRLGIDTNEVLRAMDTKWNALGFRPGLVGGHCIGVDPYYFIYEAQHKGYTSRIIHAGRQINNSMAKFVAQSTVRCLIEAEILVKGAKVYLYGLTFKENCPDIRNSKSFDICQELLSYGVDVRLVDPQADFNGLPEIYKKRLTSMDEVHDADALIFAVAHREFKQLTTAALKKLYKKDRATQVLIDVKGQFGRQAMTNAGFLYWSL